MRVTKKMKAESVRFIAGAEALFVKLGAVRVGEYHDYELQTVAGRLDLTIRLSLTGGLGTVFGRFYDPVEARKVAGGVNPHSGKWNHHYFEGWTADVALTDLERELSPVVAPTHKTAP